MRHSALALAAGLVASAGQVCAAQESTPPTAPASARATDTVRVGPMLGALSTPNADPFPSTYRPFASRPTVIRNVTILTAAGPTIRNGAILLRDGKIAEVGGSVTAPADALVVDGAGKYVAPGIIDTHSHIGAGGVPGENGTQTNDVNEATAPVTAHVWVEHSVWPQDPQFPRTLAGGVTPIQGLPAWANLIRGTSASLQGGAGA